MAMTAKQRRFVDEYLVDLNASAAARRAGYSPHRADAMGFENLRKPEIAAALCQARAELSRRLGRTVDMVLADIGKVRVNSMQLVRDPDHGAMVMASFKDALKALEMEGRHLGMFEKDNEQGRHVTRVVIVPAKTE